MADQKFDLVENPMSLIMQAHAHNMFPEKNTSKKQDIPDIRIESELSSLLSKERTESQPEEEDAPETEVSDIDSGLKKIFRIFARNHIGIETKELQEIFRKMGYKLSEENIETMQKYERNKSIRLKSFLKYVIGDLLEIEDTEETLLSAFKSFDYNGTGYLEMKGLQNVLKYLGYRLTDDELNDFVRTCEVDDDNNVNYKDLTRQLFDEQPKSSYTKRVSSTDICEV